MAQQEKTEKETKSSNVSRRDFVKIAGVAAVGVGVGGCASSKSKENNADQQVRKRNIPKRDFSGRDDYDVVVIGTGMGGAAAGAITATYGLRTLILEKNPRPGGMCSYYEKQGFYMDTGAHTFLRANKGPFGDVTRRLGMGTPIEFVRAKNTVTVKGINRDYTIPKNPILRSMVMPSVVWQMRINPIHYIPIANMFLKIMRMSEKEIEKLDNVTTEEFIKQYTDNPKMQSIFSGLLGLYLIVPPWKASAGEAVWNIKKIMSDTYVCYPKGGSVIIPQTFLKGAEDLGAEIRMNAGVRKIVVKEGKIDHVILDNGETVKTRAIISTTSAKDAILRLVGEEHVPASYAKQVKDIFPSTTGVQAKIAVKKELVKSGLLFGMYPMKTEKDVLGEFVPEAFRNMYKGEQGQYIPVYACIPTSYDPNLAPPGCQIITAVSLAPTLDVALKDTSQSWVDGMMKALHAAIPELEENIIFCDTWSVKALAEWTGKSDGSVISTAQVVGQTGKDRIGHETPIKGLYLAGDCAGSARGFCTELACQSGIECADLVASHIANQVV